MGLEVAGLYEDIGRSTAAPRHRRVFVADDDADTRNAIVTALIAEGHEVVGLEDGVQLIECLHIVARDSFRLPDLIAMDRPVGVTDGNMTEIEGLALGREVIVDVARNRSKGAASAARAGGHGI